MSCVLFCRWTLPLPLPLSPSLCSQVCNVYRISVAVRAGALEGRERRPTAGTKEEPVSQKRVATGRCSCLGQFVYQLMRAMLCCALTSRRLFWASLTTRSTVVTCLVIHEYLVEERFQVGRRDVHKYMYTHAHTPAQAQAQAHVHVHVHVYTHSRSALPPHSILCSSLGLTSPAKHTTVRKKIEDLNHVC